ncbi:hypothetical protein E4U21_007653 [Claviceps maximensis]|nr:hypothetical protein E4U21_007653 [Claviceps maximensis]
MKVQLYMCSLLAAAAAAAGPLNAPHTKELKQRDDDPIFAMTDHQLFEISLGDFINDRNARSPSTLDWWSDGCTNSPDNPLGFPYTPACNRHDFGYNNYRHQLRFTKGNKKHIDDNFHDDLDHQCDIGSWKWVCKRLADVYYLAVRVGGGRDAGRAAGSVAPSKRATTSLLAKFDELVDLYEQEVVKAQATGKYPQHKTPIREGVAHLRHMVALNHAGLSLDDIYA